MTLVALFKGLFTIAEAIPILRDAFYQAMDYFIAKRVEAARQGRILGYDQLNNARGAESAISALGVLVRNRPR